MRAILISMAILLLSGPVLAQQRKPSPPVQRTFVPKEPLPCIAFDQMASRLDAVYKVEEITKTGYDEGMRKNKEGTPEAGVDYFVDENSKYRRISLQPGNLAEFIRWYVVEGGRGQMDAANTQCTTELGEREERYAGIYNLREYQDAMTLAQAEGLLADVALEGQDLVIKALLESEAARRKDVDRHNKLIDSVNTYNKAVNDLVVTVNQAMEEPKGSNLAPRLSFNFVRLQLITCTGSTFAFTDSKAYMTNVRIAATSLPTMQCE